MKVSNTMKYDRKNRTVIPDDAAAGALAQGHPKSAPVKGIATVGNNRTGFNSAGSDNEITETGTEKDKD